MARVDSKTQPATLVVFGGTGDLIQRKLPPALHRLVAWEALHERSQILGTARRADMDDRGFRAWARQSLSTEGAEDRVAQGERR